MSPPQQHSHSSGPSTEAPCLPQLRDAENLKNSPSRMPITRRAKRAESVETPSERRATAEDAVARPSMEEARRRESQLNDQMDIQDASEDDNDDSNDEDNEDNGSLEWSFFSKRKPNRKVKPEQLRLERVSRPHFALSIRPLNKVHVHDIPKQAITAALEMTARSWELAELSIFRYDPAANCIKVTVRDEEHAKRLAALTRLAEKMSGRVRTYEVIIERTPTQKVGNSRGVIKVRPGQTIEYIKDHLRCETATILEARLLGKTNMLLLTFNTESPPNRLVFDYEITRVHEYRPKVIACYNCHGLGHIAKYCPSDEVCKQCGRKHPQDNECDEELFCVACQKQGHISLNSACPSRAPKDIKKVVQNTEEGQRTVTWAEKVLAGTSTQPTLSAHYEQQIKELRKENQQLRAMLQQILARLPPEQRDTPPPPTPRQRESETPADREKRTRSNSRVGRSISRKITANSRKPQYVGPAQTQQNQAPSVSKPLTAQDSAYAQMLSILRQERHTETQRLEKNLREEFQTVTNAIQTQMKAIFTEIQRNIQKQHDEPKRRKPADER